jgi:hypothetical protein
MGMLADSDDHILRIPTGSANVDVLIQAHCFLDPDRYRHAIKTAVEAAFGPAGSNGSQGRCTGSLASPDVKDPPSTTTRLSLAESRE